MYQMYLLQDSKEIEFPVLPETLSVSSPGQNEVVTVMNLGEVNILKKKGLREISFESFFPLHPFPYKKDNSPELAVKPIEWIKAIQSYRDERKPVRFLLLGTDLDININMSIDDLSYEERAGEVGDIYFSMKLKEWKDYSARKVNLSRMNKGKAAVSSAKRSGSPSSAKVHTVVKGDSLWSICKQRYGDGSKYPQLYAKNKALIDKKNKGTGNAKYTIYPGQVLTL